MEEGEGTHEWSGGGGCMHDLPRHLLHSSTPGSAATLLCIHATTSKHCSLSVYVIPYRIKYIKTYFSPCLSMIYFSFRECRKNLRQFQPSQPHTYFSLFHQSTLSSILFPFDGIGDKHSAKEWWIWRCTLC